MGSAGGVQAQGSTATLQNSLLALNNGGNCSASVLDGGHNLSFGDTTCPATFANGDPKLGPLQNNGGQSPTISLQPGSAAINQIPATGANCTPADSGASPGRTEWRATLAPTRWRARPPRPRGRPSSRPRRRRSPGMSRRTHGSSIVVFQYGTSTNYGKTTPFENFGGVVPIYLSASLTKLSRTPRTTTGS